MANLNPASWPRPEPLSERLLVLEPRSEAIRQQTIGDLPRLLEAGDVIVVNDAATLPAAFRTADGRRELRLLNQLGDEQRWRAILLGAGDWRLPTEARTEVERPAVGELLELGSGLQARVAAVDDEQPRLLEIRFEQRGAELWTALYRAGRPVQYAYLERGLELWHVQSRFAARPWAVELASAGRPLTFALLLALKRRGVELANLTHAAGLSSTGSAALDRRLPFPEHYAIPEATCALIETARSRGGRIVAVGTTVVRALESAARKRGGLSAGESEATLVIGPGFVPRVVDGLLTGMHESGTSHFALMQAFAPEPLLERALGEAAAAGYLQHEFGDSCLILPRPRSSLYVAPTPPQSPLGRVNSSSRKASHSSSQREMRWFSLR